MQRGHGFELALSLDHHYLPSIKPLPAASSISTFFPNARGVSIDDGTFTLVQRDENSYSSITPAQEKEDTEIDHYRDVERDEFPLWADEDRGEWRQGEPNSTATKIVQVCGNQINYIIQREKPPEFDDVRYLTGEQGIGGLHKPFITDIQFREIRRGIIYRLGDVVGYRQGPDTLDLAPQDDTSGTNPRNPFRYPVQTQFQTNQPENTAPRDHTSHGSTGSPSPFSPAENWDAPGAAPDDT
ncbi:hypothetical protein PQX77_006203, partial [Marasmius sp. AFHP31]